MTVNKNTPDADLYALRNSCTDRESTTAVMLEMATRCGMIEYVKTRYLGRPHTADRMRDTFNAVCSVYALRFQN